MIGIMRGSRKVPSAGAGITFGTVTAGTLNSTLDNYTPPSGCTSLYFVVAQERVSAGPRVVASISDGTQNAVKVDAESYTSGSSNRVEIWYLDTPTIGSSTWTVTFSVSDPSTYQVFAVPVFGSNTTTSAEASGKNNGTSNALAASITTATNGAAVLAAAVIATTTDTFTPDSPQTELYDATVGSGSSGCSVTISYKIVASAGATTAGHTCTGTPLRHVVMAVSIKPA